MYPDSKKVLRKQSSKTSIDKYVPGASFDSITANPKFNKSKRGKRPPPLPPRAKVSVFATGISNVGKTLTQASKRLRSQPKTEKYDPSVKTAVVVATSTNSTEGEKKWKMCGCWWTQRKFLCAMCCLAIFIFFFGLFFFRTPDFEQDLENLEFNAFSLQEVELEFPLIFDNVNFLPMEIYEVDATATFDNFVADIVLVDAVRLGARSEGTGQAMLRVELDAVDLFGAAGDFILACLAGREIEGIVEATATGRYLGVSADQSIPPEDILVECPIRYRQSFLEEAVEFYGSVKSLETAVLSARKEENTLEFVDLFEQLEKELNL